MSVSRRVRQKVNTLIVPHVPLVNPGRRPDGHQLLRSITASLPVQERHSSASDAGLG